jgi:predicted transcriptional regulator
MWCELVSGSNSDFSSDVTEGNYIAYLISNEYWWVFLPYTTFLENEKENRYDDENLLIKCVLDFH